MSGFSSLSRRLSGQPSSIHSNAALQVSEDNRSVALAGFHMRPDMIWWRPALEYRGSHKPWWASKKAQGYGAGGWAKRLIAEHLGGLLFEQAANDRDTLKW